MSFAQILGQPQPCMRLKNYVGEKKVPGSLLFVGPDGVGKTLAALTFAKAVNCLEDTLDSCDHCTSCARIDRLVHPDVHLLRSADPEGAAGQADTDADRSSETLTIEEIRGVQGEMNLRPYEARRKVFILQDAERMSRDAGHAFLKTLEEPQGDSIIILTTSRPALLLKTIVSRCQTVKFSSLPQEAVSRILQTRYALDPSVAGTLARRAEGSLSRALTLHKGAVAADENEVVDEFFFPRGSFSSGAKAPDRQRAREYLAVLLGWVRDMYLVKSGCVSSLMHADRIDDLVACSARYTPEHLEAMTAALTESAGFLDKNINTKLVLSNLKNVLNPTLKGHG